MEADHQSQPGPDAPQHKLGRPFKDAGRLQQLWNDLVPTKAIAAELGFYSSRNVCRSVRAMRKLGYDFLYRGAGRPKKDGTQRTWRIFEPKPPTPKQLQYWAKVADLMTERHKQKQEETKTLVDRAAARLEIPKTVHVEGGTFRCSYCTGRTNDPMGHPSCRNVA